MKIMMKNNLMERINELIAEVRKKYPEDEFYRDFDQSFQSNKECYLKYGKALKKLDDKSWKILKNKALITMLLSPRFFAPGDFAVNVLKRILALKNATLAELNWKKIKCIIMEEPIKPSLKKDF